MGQGVKCKFCTGIKDSDKIYCHPQHKQVERYKCDKNNCKLHRFEPVVEVTVAVGRCDECPFVEVERTINAGYAHDYYCKVANEGGKRRKIVGYVEWDSEIPPVPQWCPFRKEKDKNETVD
jgi:hypothetical protein